MNNERSPLLRNQDEHFEIAYQTSDISRAEDASSSGIIRSSGEKGATVFETALNIAKLCMGTGTLALPYAAQEGGLIFNMVGLGVIVVWNYYCANCLLKCLDYLPSKVACVRNDRYNNTVNTQEVTSHRYGCTEESNDEDPPSGTTTYGVIAWYALGKKGLVLLDSLMMILSVGLLIAYQGGYFIQPV